MHSPTLTLFASLLPLQGGVPQFASTAFPVESVSRNLVTLDVNGDGNCDVVTGGRMGQPHQVRCLLGDGTGNFVGASPSACPGDIYGIDSSDLDGNGIPDVVVSNGPDGMGRLQSFVGNATGAFFLTQDLFLVDDVNSIALADWNLDGLADGACGYFFGGIAILRQGPGASFVNIQDVYGGTLAPESLTFGDMDGDGLPDVVGGALNKVVIHKNLGNTFAPAVFSAAVTAWEVSLGDLDLDGALDILANNAAIRGDGAGGFFAPTPIGAGQGTNEGAIADVNRDGIPDAVFNASAGGNILLFPGTGSFTFGPSLVLATGLSNQGLALCDVDSDGQVDMVTTGPLNSVVVYRNLELPPALTAPFGTGTRGCLGRQGISATGIPNVGNSQFGIVATNTPLTATGLAIVANLDDLAGGDPFGLSVLLHVDLVGSTEVLALDIAQLTEGSSYMPLPIPNNPFLVGLTYFAQVLSVWNKDAGCAPSPFLLSSSAGLRIRIL